MILKKIFSFLKYNDIKFKLIFLFIIFLSLLIFVLDGLTIFAFLPLISDNPENNFSNFTAYEAYIPNFVLNYFKAMQFKDIFLICMFAVLIRTLTFIFRNYVIYRFCKFTEINASKKFYYNLINKTYLNFYKETSSQILKDFRDSIGAYAMFVEHSTRIIADTIIFLSFSILLIYISFEQTILIFLYFLILIISFNKVLARFTFRLGKKMNQSSNKINFTIINTYKNFSQIIIRSLKNKYMEKVLSHVNDYSFSRLFNTFLQINTKQVIEIFAIVFIFLIFFFLEKTYSYNDFIVLASIYIISAYRLLPIVGNLISSYLRLSNLDYGFSIIHSKIKSIELNYKNNKFKQKNTKGLTFSDSLKLINISFRYENKKNFIIKKLNLVIKKNHMIGIKGTSGKGKSTLIKIILGLIKATDGNMYLDNKKIVSNNIKDYQSFFSYLPQENLFIPGTLKENIAFGEDKINLNKIKKSLKIANCNNFVKKLKNGLNHEIEENGKNFSTGQLQRLALARALYFDTEIVILDEPTSALDGQAEIQFNKLMLSIKKIKTVIIISHKSKSLKYCDFVYELSQNKLVKKK